MSWHMTCHDISAHDIWHKNFYIVTSLLIILHYHSHFLIIGYCTYHAHSQGGRGVRSNSPSVIVDVSCVAKLMVQIFSECIYEDPFSFIPLLSLIFTLGCVYITGGCNSSTIQPTVANPRANQTSNWTPLCACLATCLHMATFFFLIAANQYFHLFNAMSMLFLNVFIRRNLFATKTYRYS